MLNPPVKTLDMQALQNARCTKHANVRNRYNMEKVQQATHETRIKKKTNKTCKIADSQTIRTSITGEPVEHAKSAKPSKEN